MRRATLGVEDAFETNAHALETHTLRLTFHASETYTPRPTLHACETEQDGFETNAHESETDISHASQTCTHRRRFRDLSLAD